MDGMPKSEPFLSGELCVYPSVQGPILLNFDYPSRQATRRARVVVDDQTSTPVLRVSDNGVELSLGPFGFLDCRDYLLGKYVHFKDGRIALFADTVTHANVPQWLGCDRVAVRSAGFIEICLDAPVDMGVRCFGESLSLERYSRGLEDGALVVTMLGRSLFAVE